MIRLGSQITYCSPEKIVHRMALELNEQNRITRLFNLVDGNVESAQTLFFDGILSSEIVSLKQNMPAGEISARLINYRYYDFSESIPSYKIKLTNKPLILDIGTNSPEKINKLFPLLFQVLADFSIFDIIAAFTFYPSILLGKEAGLAENYINGIMLWENVDLVGKKLTSDTFISRITHINPT